MYFLTTTKISKVRPRNSKSHLRNLKVYLRNSKVNLRNSKVNLRNSKICLENSKNDLRNSKENFGSLYLDKKLILIYLTNKVRGKYHCTTKYVDGFERLIANTASYDPMVNKQCRPNLLAPSWVFNMFQSGDVILRIFRRNRIFQKF